jgi:magnesium transporter
MSDVLERCTATTPTRCRAHTRLYRDGVLVDEGFDVAAISDHLADPSTVVWLDLLQPDEADMAVLVEEFGLHPLAIEDALHAHQRPKLDRYADHEFLAAYDVRLEHDEVRSSEVAAFLTDRALVTVRKDPSVDLRPVLRRWDASPELAVAGVSFLVHGLVDVLVDGYTAVARALDDDGDALEGDLFADDVAQRDLQRRTFALRSCVAALRRVVAPTRDVVLQLGRRDHLIADDRTAPYFRDVEDHLLRVQATLEELRELLATVLDTTLAVQGQRLNETIFKLTAYAAILAVTTAVTGFFGQNIPYPGIEERSGFVASTVVLVASVVGLYVYFKRKGWL